jgi:hypothetical protein
VQIALTDSLPVPYCPAWQAVPPKLSLTSEGLSAYMASLQEKRRLLEERRKRAQTHKQVRFGGGSAGSGSMRHTRPKQGSQHTTSG